MCIINGPVRSVTTTQILIVPYGDRTFVAYSNKVDSAMSNAMILPVPYPDTVRFQDLTNISDLFSKCNKSFPTEEVFETLSFSNGRDSIPVIDVGSYKVSLCLNSADLDNLNTNHFRINPGVRQLFQNKYDKSNVPFGYIVCKLREGEHTYHPLGYSSKSWHSKMFFVPTFHHHSGGLLEEVNAEWDHEIFSLNTTLNAGELGSKLCFDTADLGITSIPNAIIRRMKISGVYRNSDIYLTHNTKTNNSKYLGVDGCVFKYTDPNKILTFEPAILSTVPVFNVGEKKIVLAFDHTPHDPLVFFGSSVNISINNNIITIIDNDNDDQYRCTYKFDLNKPLKFAPRIQKWILPSETHSFRMRVI